MDKRLASLGLIPSSEHPDLELFQLTAEKREREAAWRQRLSKRKHEQLLSKWRVADAGTPLYERIARIHPQTFEGLLEKIDAALMQWDMDDGSDRCLPIWSELTSTLAQARDVLRALKDTPAMPDSQ